MNSRSHSSRKHRTKKLPVVRYNREYSREDKPSRQKLCFEKRFKFPSPCSHNINVFHVIIGLCAGALTLTGTLLGIGGSYYGAGFWGSLFFILTGCLGFCAHRKKNLCTFVCYVTVTSLSMVAALFVVTLAAVNIGPAQAKFRHMPNEKNKVLLMHMLNLCFAMLEMINCGFTCAISHKVYKEFREKLNSKTRSKHIRTKLVPNQNRDSIEVNTRIIHERKPLHCDPDSSMVIAGENNDPFNDLNISIIHPVPKAGATVHRK